ncbi:ribonuclease P protein subunit p40 isoform X2 [Fopius arisanus]|uniref:Ribonuclease P protein subunit p40 isoform X2 n=1 Tax=Fopius arisanus TaxID=64838 RepID=A0A9R1TTL6_9HYME|nr:PREDICTED: ribonuclease P protein subunit p40-like isoform X2 [Fopius arisanus]
MLCPKVWDLKAPQHHNEIAHWRQQEVPLTISNHYYNHSVSVVAPHKTELPVDIVDNILEDSEYYKVEALPVWRIIDKEFIEAFVKKGELTLLSINTRIDLENCICVTPKGQLVLSLRAEDYQKLGIEGKGSYFDRVKNSRYVVQVDLKKEAFTPGKRNYERVRKCLEENLEQVFDVIVIWEAPETNLCPSSVAAWFHQKGYKVSLCRQRYSKRLVCDCRIPSVSPDCNDEKFIEWLGIISIGGDVKNEDPENYMNSYISPCPNASRGDVFFAEWRGFFSRKRLEGIYKKLQDYVEHSSASSSWLSLHVQGFADSPVSWGLKEHSFYTDGDNSYTIVFHSNGEKLISKSLSSNNKPRKIQ